MLTFSKDSTKQEKFVIGGLWGIALYHIIVSIVAVGSDIYLSQFNVITLVFGMILFVTGIGLLLEKVWALQVATLFYFMIILGVIGTFLGYLDGRSLDMEESIISLVTLMLATLCYFILTHNVSTEHYGTGSIFFDRVKIVLLWTIGVGFVGFCISWIYMEGFTEGVYRGFVVVYGTIFFVGLGFVIGSLRAFFFKKK